MSSERTADRVFIVKQTPLEIVKDITQKQEQSYLNLAQKLKRDLVRLASLLVSEKLFPGLDLRQEGEGLKFIRLPIKSLEKNERIVELEGTGNLVVIRKGHTEQDMENRSPRRYIPPRYLFLTQRDATDREVIEFFPDVVEQVTKLLQEEKNTP